MSLDLLFGLWLGALLGGAVVAALFGALWASHIRRLRRIFNLPDEQHQDTTP